MVAEYNFDGSEIETDYFHVNFYGSVDFEHEYQYAMRESQIAAMKAKAA
jgi:hypothetical protein